VRICHLFDDTAGWQHRVAAGQLLDRLPPERFAACLAAVNPAGRQEALQLSTKVELFAHRFGVPAFTAPALREYVETGDSLVCAWGIRAALAAATAQAPLCVYLFDPGFPPGQAKMLRSIQHRPGFAIACATRHLLRRLVEAGIDPQVCAVVRPGIDFALLNRARRSSLRSALGFDRQDRVFLTAEPVTRSAGQFTAFWAVALRSICGDATYLLLPGHSREKDRIRRIARQVKLEHVLREPGPQSGFEELVAIADVLLLPAAEDVPTTAIGWAMAAGVPVIGTAIHAIAEILAHRSNALLIKPEAPRSMAMKLARLMMDEKALQAIRDTARTQAYEVFSIRRFIDQSIQLFENTRNSKPAAEGITDAALRE
jgi:hypothetical protein